MKNSHSFRGVAEKVGESRVVVFGPCGLLAVGELADLRPAQEQQTDHVAEPAGDRLEECLGREALEGRDDQHDDGEDHCILLQAPFGECEPPVERVEDHAEEHEA